LVFGERKLCPKLARDCGDSISRRPFWRITVTDADDLKAFKAGERALAGQSATPSRA